MHLKSSTTILHSITYKKMSIIQKYVFENQKSKNVPKYYYFKGPMNLGEKYLSPTKYTM